MKVNEIATVKAEAQKLLANEKDALQKTITAKDLEISNLKLVAQTEKTSLTEKSAKDLSDQ